MKADYVHKDSMTLEEKPQVFTRWIDPTIMELKQENQELKQKYLNAVADYETTMSELQELKADYGNKAQVERDLLLEENQELKKQLRTSAIFNEGDIRLDQTKKVFETLANILSTESCSYRYLIYDLLGFKKENYVDLIAGMSITNAIVELEELKKQLDEKNKPQIFIDTQDMEERYSEGLYQDYLEEENKKYKNQQKDFIEYISKTIEELECDNVDDEEMKGYLIQRIDTFKEILSKYKSIIGVENEN